jgi:hypothetical protein
MLSMKISVKFILLLMFVITFNSCIEEDPDLINPPPQTESIHVRLFNLSGNNKPASLLLDGKTEIGPVEYGSCSEAIHPPGDSSTAIILQEGEEKLQLNRKIRFTKDNYFTIFALPTAVDAPDSVEQREIDTIIISSTLSGLIKNDGMAYIRFFNAVPNLKRTYSLRRGCPGGDILANNVGYRQSSLQTEVWSEGTPVSVIRIENGRSEIIGLFNIDLEEKKQYMIVAMESSDGTEKLLLLDEFDNNTNPLIQLEPEDNLTTQIRNINLSDVPVDFIKYPDINLVNNIIQTLEPKTVGEYIDISACSGQSLDTIAAFVNGDTASMVSTSLDVSEKYTFMTFDSAGSKAKLSVLSKPHRVKSSNYAVIRVVQAAYKYDELVVSMAARDDNPYSNDIDSLGFRSGDLISDKIGYGKISEPKLVLPGDNLPVTVFTGTQPANLAFTTTMSLETSKDYLLLITSDETEDLKIYLIEKSDESISQLRPLDKAVFAQFINLVPGKDNVYMSLDPILTRAKLNYGASIATVISEGSHLLKVDDKDTIINAKSSERILFIYAGVKDTIDFIPFTYGSFETSSAFYQRRFINACKDINMISIKENSDTTAPVAERIAYGKSSSLQKITLERNLSLFFIETSTDSTRYRVDDLPFPFGKNYSIIFGGSKKDSSYSVVVQQEY